MDDLHAYHDGVLGQLEPGMLRSFDDGSLGSYFDAENAEVPRPARSLLNGPLMSYAEGILGGSPRDAALPGAEAAFSDGILGLGLPLFIDGKEVAGPVTIHHGQQWPYGPGGGEVTADSPTTLDAAEERGYFEDWTPKEELYPEYDGILGTPPYPQVMPGPLLTYRDGTLGRPRYYRNPAGPAMTGLGATKALYTVDLKNQQALKEVKVVMARTAMALNVIADPDLRAIVEDDDWYKSLYWENRGTTLLDAIVATYQKNINPEAVPGMMMVTTSKGSYPTVQGLVAMLQLSLIAAEPNFASDYPVMKDFLAAAVKATGPESVAVSSPWFSEADQIRAAGIGFGTVSTTAMVIMGGVAVVALAAIFWPAKKR